MNQPGQPLIDVNMVFHMLVKYRLRWIVPAVVMATIALIFAVFHTPSWESSQALLVRDEMIGGSTRPGRFDDPELMKTAQETVLELAKSRSVLTAALVEVGPPARHRWKSGPPVAAVESLEEATKVKAPNGAEFGRTEVFYISVKDKDRERAVALTKAVCNQLDNRLQELRDRRAQNLVDELSNTAKLASHDLHEVTLRLSEKERSVGSDLAELRILNESSSGESNLRQTLVEVRNELRQAKRDQQTTLQFEKFLIAAQKDPYQLISIPNRLIEAQQSLRQLRDGLVAAKLRTAQLLGDLTPNHPRAKASIVAQREIEQHIHDELQTSIGALRAELKLGELRVQELESQILDIERRMNRLAAVRAGYGNLVIEVAQRGEILSKAQQDLSDARASLAAANSVSLITLLDGPSTGNSPVGLGRSAIALCGLFGGLMTGLGLLFLTVPTVGSIPQGDSTQDDTSSSHLNGASNDWVLPGGLSLKNVIARLSKLAPTWN